MGKYKSKKPKGMTKADLNMDVEKPKEHYTRPKHPRKKLLSDRLQVKVPTKLYNIFLIRCAELNKTPSRVLKKYLQIISTETTEENEKPITSFADWY